MKKFTKNRTLFTPLLFAFILIFSGCSDKKSNDDEDDKLPYIEVNGEKLNLLEKECYYRMKVFQLTYFIEDYGYDLYHKFAFGITPAKTNIEIGDNLIDYTNIPDYGYRVYIKENIGTSYFNRMYILKGGNIEITDIEETAIVCKYNNLKLQRDGSDEVLTFNGNVTFTIIK